MQEAVDAVGTIAQTELTIQQWLLLLVFGMAFGAGGQVIRSVAGLKKVNDEADSLDTTASSIFDMGRFVRSLLIGGIAGFLAVLATVNPEGRISVQLILGIMAAGYAGADFIEAFARKHLPSMTPEQVKAAAAKEQPPAADPAPPAAAAAVNVGTSEALG